MSTIPEGSRFGRWTVVGPGFSRKKSVVYPCICDCGTERDVEHTRLSIGRSRSCGCAKGAYIAQANANANARRYINQDRGYSTLCWIWTGNISRTGYGMTAHRGNGKAYAHRWMYEHTYGKLPDFPEQQLHHLCEQKSCVNPDHLQLLAVTDHRRTYNTKLNLEQATEIRHLYSTGAYTHAELAEQYGVSRGSILNVVKNRTWRDPSWLRLTFKQTLRR